MSFQFTVPAEPESGVCDIPNLFELGCPRRGTLFNITCRVPFFGGCAAFRLRRFSAFGLSFASLRIPASPVSPNGDNNMKKMDTI